MNSPCLLAFILISFLKEENRPVGSCYLRLFPSFQILKYLTAHETWYERYSILFIYLSICLSLYLSIYLSTYLSIYIYIYLWLYRLFVEPWPLFQFLNLFTQTVCLLGRVISSSQGHYLNTGQHKHRINANRHPCLEWNSNPHSQRSRERRQIMSYSAATLIGV
jgi:hypothetical protein